MMVPSRWRGDARKIKFDSYTWLQQFRGRVFCRLFEEYPSSRNDYDFFDEYDIFVVSWHLEPIDIEWINTASKRTNKPIIVLADVFDMQYDFAHNVIVLPFIYWHHQLAKAREWFPDARGSSDRKITHKASAICNRITQSKLLITTALLEHMQSSAIVRLGTWIEEKNVHWRQPTGNATLDCVSEIFWTKYFGQEITIDNYVDHYDNFQGYTCNPSVPYLQNVALHFTNETFAYSFMADGGRRYIYPGPFLTEKTLKCLLAGVAFIPVGQYRTLSALSRLGLQFDYGFDTSWDEDAANLTRLESLINLVKWLSDFSADDIYSMVKSSEAYNFDHVWSGDFARQCEIINQHTIDNLIRQFG